MKKVLFCGASGYGNLGDDAYKYVLSEKLGGKYRLFFDSPYPDLPLVDQMDYVVIGGGGVIYNNSTNHFKYMSSYLDRAEKSNIPYSFCSCGIQPAKHKDGSAKDIASELQIWKPYLTKADFVSLRSPTGVKIMEALAGSDINAHYVPDLCYLITPVNYSLTKPGSVAIVLTNNALKKEKVKKVLKKYEHYGDRRYVVVMSDVDEQTSLNYAKSNISSHGSYRYRNNLSPVEAAAIFRDSDYVISARYHGHILARAVGHQEDTIEVIDGRFKSRVEVIPNSPQEAEAHITLLTKHIN